MTVHLTAFVRAPIDDVFAFFDVAENTSSVNEHAVGISRVEAQPDGRRTVDIEMVADARQWTQTIEQVLREPPIRLVTSSWTWTSDRRQRQLTLVNDRRFSRELGGTRIEATIDYRLDRPWRRPLQATSNWLRRGAARREFERQLSAIVDRIEAGDVT